MEVLEIAIDIELLGGLESQVAIDDLDRSSATFETCARTIAR